MDSLSLNNGRKAEEIFEGQAVLGKYLLAYLDSMILKWCVELAIPDIIHKHGKPITLHELVSVLQVPPPKISGVVRLMRYLARNGIFEIVRIHGNQKEEDEEEEEAYDLTVASELLVRGSFPSLAPLIDSALHQDLTNQFNHLSKWSCSEDSLCKISTGFNIWEFVNSNSARFDRFNKGMASDSQMISLAIRDHCSVFEGLESIVDVGGGTGTVAKIISNMVPELKCIVFDRPEVVANLPESNNNVSFVGGNMFQFIPKADAVLLKWILHDWSDDRCIKILEKCKEAIPGNNKGGKIIIIDTVISEKQDRPEIVEMKLKMDILMTTSMNGRERNEQEWKKLFMTAGIKDYKISPLTQFYSIIEAYP